MPAVGFPSIGLPELLIILAILIFIFGVGKVADVGGALGRSIREFRRELRGGSEEEPATKAEEKGEEKKATQRKATRRSR